MIKWNSPKFDGNEIKYVTEVLNTGYVSEGPFTKKLEEELKKVVNAKHIIMTTSATAALYLAIEADKRIRGYTEGEAIIPNSTFVATKNSVEMAGLIPRIEDVNKDNFILSNITDNPKTRITCVVNLLGRKANLVGNNSYIKELNEETGDIKNISRSVFIYDNAGCLGSNVPNGKVGCYSLQANKLITSAGQGGFCATDDDKYAKVIRQLKDFGRENKDQNDTTGFNFKFNDIQAAVALAQLEKLDERKLLHINQYNLYKEELSEYGKFVEYRIGEDLRDTEVPLWVEFITDKRDELYYYLLSKGIECREPWKCLIEDEKKYPNSKFYQDNVLWLPNGSSLTLLEQTEVIKNIKEFFLGLFSQI